MSAIIATRCTNEAGSSADTGYTTYTIWTTGVDAPAASASIWSDGWGAVGWNTVSCPPNTTPYYRAIQDVTNGANNQTIYGWQTGTYQALNAMQGYPQAAHNDAKCVGPNAESTMNWNANTNWTAAMNPPSGLWAGAGGNCGWRVACWGASCAAGGTVYYVWAVRDTYGNDKFWDYNWNTYTSYSNTGVAWGNGTMNMSAICRTPYAQSPQAGTSSGF